MSTLKVGKKLKTGEEFGKLRVSDMFLKWPILEPRQQMGCNKKTSVLLLEL